MSHPWIKLGLCLVLSWGLSLSARADVLRSVSSIPVDVPATQANVPLGVHVYLDRVVYTDRDRDGQGLVVINPPAMLYSGQLKDHRVRVRVQGPSGQQIGQAMEAAVTDSDHFALDLDMPRAAPGEYKVIASLLDAQGQVLATGEIAFTKRQDTSPALPALPVDVPLVLTSHPMIASMGNVPISTGIPLPDGLLDDASQVTLLEDGKEIPCQTTVRARWSRRGSIKWMGLDFQAKYANGQPHQYTLRLGTPGNAAMRQLVVLAQADEAYTLSNGVVELAINRASFKLFDRVVLDRNRDGQFTEDETLLLAKPLDGPYWESAAGKKFYAALDASPQVVVEESGPLRSTLRIDAWLTAEDGMRAGKSTTRISLQAGKPQAQVNQTFLITWDTQKNDGEIDLRVADMGVKTSPVELEKAFRLPPYAYYDLPAEGYLYQLIDRWDRMKIADSQQDKTLLASSSDLLRYNTATWLNSRSPLSFGGYGPRGSVTVTQRYMAEKFPKQISVGKHELTWHAWPRNGTSELGDPLSEENIGHLFWLHQGKLLDFQIPDDYFTAIENLRKRYTSRITLLIYKNTDSAATGTAITGELLYTFTPENQGGNPATWNQTAPLVVAFESHPHATADPQWAWATDLLEFAPPVDPGYPNIERGVSGLFDRMMADLEQDQRYGQFLWPNGSTYPGRSFPSLHRKRVNAHHGTELVGWALYLRSGEAKYWHYASAFSRYLLDHASVNWDAADPHTQPGPSARWPGSVHHCQGLVPWSTREPELLGHMSPQWHACLLYYMTGDTQAMDFAKAAATSVLKSIRTDQDYRVREPYKGHLNRNAGCGWAMVTNLYAELLDARLLRPVGDIGKQIIDGPELRLDGNAPPEGQSGRWWWHTYIQQWRDPLAIEAINNLSPGGGLSFAAYNTVRAKNTGDPTSIYALWMETQGAAPLRQFGLGHPEKIVAASPAADNFNFLMPLITGMRALNLPETPQLVPTLYAPKTSSVVFREDQDRAFTLRFWGPVYEGPEDPVKYKPIPYILTGPEGKEILKGEINRKQLGVTPDKAITVSVPADGVTGQYTLRFPEDLYPRQQLMAPLSDLPGEVYVVPAGSILTATDLFWKPAPGEKQRTFSQPHMRLGENYSVLLRLEREDGSFTHAEESPASITVKVQAGVMYRLSMCIAGQTGYAWRWKGIQPPGWWVSPGPDMVLSVDEARWFKPQGQP
jgi:hypothetical protein